MSKKFLKNQAEELLNVELICIKGGLDPNEIQPDCEIMCSSGCAVACAGCTKKT